MAFHKRKSSHFEVMNKKVLVYKFGGASVKDGAGMRNVASIIRSRGDADVVVVVSAIGVTTNRLEVVVDSFFGDKGKAVKQLDEIRHWHHAYAAELFSVEEVGEVKVKIDRYFDSGVSFLMSSTSQSYDLVYDQIVSIGELVSTTILSTFLNREQYSNIWLDSRKCIATDNTYREGRVDWEVTQRNILEIASSALKEGGVVVTQGFLGRSATHFTTTLGREGSDYSAAIFSYCLDAASMTIWKDVPGILTGDPRMFEHVTKIDNLSYREAIEMTYYGAKVIHPKTIKPLQNKGIPLYVRDFRNPQSSGSVITSDGEYSYPPIVVIEKEQVLLHISTKDFSFVAEHHLSDLFEVFARYRFKVNLMRNTAISFSVCLTNKPRTLDELIATLQKEYKVRVQHDLELITIRHYNEAIIREMKDQKTVLFEERIPKTIQLVVQQVVSMKRKA